MPDGTDEKRRSVPRMLGDFLREAAVLVVVFFPLENYFRGLAGNAVAAPPTPLVRVVELSAGLLIAGMMLEKIDFGHLAVRLLDYTLERLAALKGRLGRKEP